MTEVSSWATCDIALASQGKGYRKHSMQTEKLLALLCAGMCCQRGLPKLKVCNSLAGGPPLSCGRARNGLAEVRSPFCFRLVFYKEPNGNKKVTSPPHAYNPIKKYTGVVTTVVTPRFSSWCFSHGILFFLRKNHGHRLAQVRSPPSGTLKSVCFLMISDGALL